jgi:Bacterial PH domain
MAYLYGRRSLRLSLRILFGGWPHLLMVVVAGLSVMLLVGRGRSEVVAGILLLLLGLLAAASTLWLSIRADAAGITIRNPFRSYRIAWDDVVLVSSVKANGYWWPSHIEVTRAGTWALPDGYSFSVGVTFGLGDVERGKIVEHIAAQGEALGFDIRTASGHQWEVWSRMVAQSEPAETEYAWRVRVEAEAPETVRCAMCGRIGPPGDMEPFGRDSGEPAWYCRSNDACSTSVEPSEELRV